MGEVVPVDTLDEAISEAGFTPLLPTSLPSDLPAEPSSIGVQQTPLGSEITLSYAITTSVQSDAAFPGMEDVQPQQSQSITLRVLNSEIGLPDNLPGIVSEVTVRGQQGTLSALADQRVTLSWVEDGMLYTLTSVGYGEAEVMQIAEDLE
jgi:hypothetical protein